MLIDQRTAPTRDGNPTCWISQILGHLLAIKPPSALNKTKPTSSRLLHHLFLFFLILKLASSILENVCERSRSLTDRLRKSHAGEEGEGKSESNPRQHPARHLLWKEFPQRGGWKTKGGWRQGRKRNKLGKQLTKGLNRRQQVDDVRQMRLCYCRRWSWKAEDTFLFLLLSINYHRYCPCVWDLES